jgi:hypothetical protein
MYLNNMERNEIFDKVLEHLKKLYDDGSHAMEYIPTFIEQTLKADEKHASYICEKLETLGIVTQQRVNGSNYKWTVSFNAAGSDWMDRHGSWTEFEEAQNAQERYGVKITSRNVEILNRVFLLNLYNKQAYVDSLEELIDASKTKKYEHFICRELSWVEKELVDGKYAFIGVEDEDELDHFLNRGMFNYLLEPDNKSAEISSMNLVINAQNVNISIITDALTTTLSRDQIAELRRIFETNNSEEDRKKKIINKLASFGQGVAEKVLANILSKGDTWQAIGQGLGKLLE